MNLDFIPSPFELLYSIAVSHITLAITIFLTIGLIIIEHKILIKRDISELTFVGFIKKDYNFLGFLSYSFLSSLSLLIMIYFGIFLLFSSVIFSGLIIFIILNFIYFLILETHIKFFYIFIFLLIILVMYYIYRISLKYKK